METLNEKYNQILNTSTVLSESKEGDYKAVELPYAYSALEPFVDEETMDIHYNKHYKGYIKKLNELTKKRTPLKELITNCKAEEKIRFNAGGAYNHEQFWSMMSPRKSVLYGTEVYDLIKSKYNNLADFKSEFVEKATSIHGSGWCWLVKKKSTVDIITTPNQDNPLMDNKGLPLLGIDMWEHAYYLKHHSEKKDWVKAFFDVVNWDYCNELLSDEKSV